MAPQVRVLLVEDFEPFRRFVRLELLSRAEFKIVGEAEDGLVAVQMAKHLQPDLILLDIGLPTLNGIAAAQQIRSFAPQAKLLFISMESSPAVAREAFRVGAHGYIHKLRTALDLIPGIEAVLAGRRFASSDLQLGDSVKLRRHEVQFYSDETVFLESAVRFISEALKADGAAIVVATRPHRDSLIQRWKEEAFDINGAIQQGTYVSLDAAEAISKIIVNGLPDNRRFFDSFTSVIESSLKATKTEHPRIAVVGECAGLLCAEGNTAAAIQLEKNTHGLLERHDIDVLCPYPLNSRTTDQGTFNCICEEHTALFSR